MEQRRGFAGADEAAGGAEAIDRFLLGGIGRAATAGTRVIPADDEQTSVPA
jgi:hypothetical protein